MLRVDLVRRNRNHPQDADGAGRPGDGAATSLKSRIPGGGRHRLRPGAITRLPAARVGPKRPGPRHSYAGALERHHGRRGENSPRQPVGQWRRALVLQQPQPLSVRLGLSLLVLDQASASFLRASS